MRPCRVGKQCGEVPALFGQTRAWSTRRWAPAQFRRSDFLGDPTKPLDQEVRRKIYEEVGVRHTGPIYLLANLRYFGHVINPIASYYCFSEDESQLEFIVAEVNNTPWNERHSYVIEGPEKGAWLNTEFDKKFHVSPFNPMSMRYHWRSCTPDRRLILHMENRSEGERVFDATLSLSTIPLTATNLNKLLIRHPFMTLKVGLAIYWQALRLYLKGVPVHNHPGKHAIGANNE